MADNIKLVTYSGSTVTPLDDALVYEKAIGQSGIIYGAEITLKNTNTLHISAGHGVICGRKFSVVDSDIPVQLTAGATNPGRVYIHLDLSNTTEPIQIMTEVAATLTTPIQQEDVNINNGVYEFDMATFTIDAQTISEVVNVFPTIENTTGNLGELTTEDKSSLVAAVNEVNKKGVAVLDSYEEIMANTSDGKAAGAKGVKEGFAQLSDSLGGLQFGVDKDGNYGYIKAGADSVTPFKSGEIGCVVNKWGAACTGNYFIDNTLSLVSADNHGISVSTSKSGKRVINVTCSNSQANTTFMLYKLDSVNNVLETLASGTVSTSQFWNKTVEVNLNANERILITDNQKSNHVTLTMVIS